MGRETYQPRSFSANKCSPSGTTLNRTSAFRIRLFPTGRAYFLPVPRLPQFVSVVYRKEHRFRTSMRTGASPRIYR
jgi:hypothetical protein